MAANPETVPSNEQRLIDALRRAGGYLPKTDLARAAGVRELLVPEYMRGLCKQGRTKMVGDSAYALPDWEPEVGCGGGARPAANDESAATTVTSTADVTPINPPRRRGRPPRVQAESKPPVASTPTEQPSIGPHLSIPPREGIEGSFDAERGVAVLTQGAQRIEIYREDMVAIEAWLSAIRTGGLS